jgi:hypothetical protein
MLFSGRDAEYALRFCRRDGSALSIAKKMIRLWSRHWSHMRPVGEALHFDLR